jgi:hypothetical protein
VLLHFGDLERKRPDVLNRLQKAGIDTAQKVSEYEMVTTMAKEYAKLTGVTCLAVACSLYGIIGGRRLNAAIGDTEGSNRQGQASKHLATSHAAVAAGTADAQHWQHVGQSTGGTEASRRLNAAIDDTEGSNCQEKASNHLAESHAAVAAGTVDAQHRWHAGKSNGDKAGGEQRRQSCPSNILTFIFPQGAQQRQLVACTCTPCKPKSRCGINGVAAFVSAG